jgi:hypothetical protein
MVRPSIHNVNVPLKLSESKRDGTAQRESGLSIENLEASGSERSESSRVILSHALIGGTTLGGDSDHFPKLSTFSFV